MALRIIKAAEPITVERINLCLYAPPGLGKTTLSFTAEDPLGLDFDNGSYRAPNRKDTVRVSSWSEASGITAEDLAPYKTVLVDTAGRCLDFLTADIIKENPKMGRGGALTLQGYGLLKTRFSAWLKHLNTLGKDVVLIAHMDEQRNGEEVIERLDVQGGSKGEIYKSMDAMGRLFIRDKKRVLDFSPRENAFGKNPAGFDVLEVPDISVNNHFLADVIRDIKAKLNQLSAEQKSAMEEVERWIEAIGEYSDPAHFNGQISAIKKAPKSAQMAFAAAAKKLGFTYNDKLHCYEAQTCSQPA